MQPLTTQRIQRRLGNAPSERVASLLRRAKIQIEFVERFAEMRNDSMAGALATKAAEVLEAFDGDLDQLAASVAQIEETLGPVAPDAKKHVVHCVGHGHIDMNWMWSWPETVATTHDTFASVLSLMEQYPDLTYSQSQASVYALIEKYHPDQFKEIQKRVAEGRWEITAVHWVEGDKNLAHGEALARHLLYTRRYIQDKFGLGPEDLPLDWEPDTFGHANTIPGILAQGGVKFYYACRTGGGHHHEKIGEPRPPLFWWEGPDGSRLLVNRETTWYNSYVNIGDNIALPMVDFCGQTGLTDWLNIFGVGNHGGGPTHTEIEWFQELQTYPVYPEVRFSTARDFYEKAIQDIGAFGLELPVIDHELNYEFTGCYTSQSTIKRANRFGERFCLEAETLSVLSGKDNRAALREAWISVLFNQFHDILPGSGVAATREHASALFQEVGAITGAIKREALKQLGSQIDTISLLPPTPEGEDEKRHVLENRANHPFVAGVGLGAGISGISNASGGGRRFLPVVVTNLCAWERSEIVEVVLWDIDIDPGLIVARDDHGRQYPTKVISQSAPGAEWGHTKTTLVFPAIGIPSLGYKAYVFCEGVPTVDVPTVEIRDDCHFEAGPLSLSFDRYESGVEVSRDARMPDSNLWGPQLRWAMTQENPRGMTSWVLGGENGEDCAPHILPAKGYWVGGTSRNGGTNLPSGSSFCYPIRQELVVPGTESRVVVHALVHALSPRIDFSADIDWREIGTPERGIPGLALQATTPDWDVRRFETPFGSVDRPECLGSAVPTLRYAHIASRDSAITYLQDWAYGWMDDAFDPGYRVIRSSFDPDHAPEVGKSTIRYSVVYHEEEQPASELTRLGAAHNHPLLVTGGTLQAGDLPATQSYAEVLNSNILLSSLKPSEDGAGVVLRLVEYDGQDTLAMVKLHAAVGGGATKAELLDLMERPTGQTAQIEGGTLHVTVPAKSFVSVRLS